MKRTTVARALVVLASIIPVILGIRWLNELSSSTPDNAVNIKIQLEGVRDHANLVRNADGSHSYRVMNFDRTIETLTPDEFADRLYQQQSSRSLLAVLFNVSSPLGFLWVSLGFVGQFLFTGRMVVQWLVSEKSHRSVVPPIFWWLSLLGSAMLLAYFLWRRDAVGVIGQAFGLGIYLRNIYFIRQVEAEQAQAMEPLAAAPAAKSV